MIDEHEGKHLVGETSLGRLYMYWEEFKSNQFLHIRYWYQDKKDGVWKPGKKGIAIPQHKVGDLLTTLRPVINEKFPQAPKKEPAGV